MKKIFVLLALVAIAVIFLIARCSDNSPLDVISMSPGTLGVSATEDLNCTEANVEYAIDDLLDTRPFSIPDKDSLAVNWWSKGGYDFLNYRCILVKKNLYMITIDTDGESSTIVSIRSRYSYKKKKWIFATDFKRKDEVKASYAMKCLMEKLQNCEGSGDNE